MTPVHFHFVTPNGLPVANTDFIITLEESSFEALDSGVVLPKQVLATTDAEGKAIVDLWPANEIYHVHVEDAEACVSLHYKFRVPKVASGAFVRLQDIVIDLDDDSYNPDEVTNLRALAEAAAAAAASAAASAASATLRANDIEVSAQASEDARIAAEAALASAQSTESNVIALFENNSTGTGSGIEYLTAAPTTGTHARGKQFGNANAAVLGEPPDDYIITGWICLTGGTPGVWAEIKTWQSGPSTEAVEVAEISGPGFVGSDHLGTVNVVGDAYWFIDGHQLDSVSDFPLFVPMNNAVHHELKIGIKVEGVWKFSQGIPITQPSSTPAADLIPANDRYELVHDSLISGFDSFRTWFAFSNSENVPSDDESINGAQDRKTRAGASPYVGAADQAPLDYDPFTFFPETGYVRISARKATAAELPRLTPGQTWLSGVMMSPDLAVVHGLREYISKGPENHGWRGLWDLEKTRLWPTEGDFDEGDGKKPTKQSFNIHSPTTNPDGSGSSPNWSGWIDILGGKSASDLKISAMERLPERCDIFADGILRHSGANPSKTEMMPVMDLAIGGEQTADFISPTLESDVSPIHLDVRHRLWQRPSQAVWGPTITTKPRLVAPEQWQTGPGTVLLIEPGESSNGQLIERRIVRNSFKIPDADYTTGGGTTYKTRKTKRDEFNNLTYQGDDGTALRVWELWRIVVNGQTQDRYVYSDFVWCGSVSYDWSSGSAVEVPYVDEYPEGTIDLMANGITDWVPKGGTIQRVGQTILVSADGSDWASARLDVTLEIGQRYSLEWYGIQGTSGTPPQIHIGNVNGYNSYADAQENSPIEFTVLDAPVVNFYINVGSQTAGQTNRFGGLILSKIDAQVEPNAVNNVNIVIADMTEPNDAEIRYIEGNHSWADAQAPVPAFIAQGASLKGSSFPTWVKNDSRFANFISSAYYTHITGWSLKLQKEGVGVNNVGIQTKDFAIEYLSKADNTWKLIRKTDGVIWYPVDLVAFSNLSDTPSTVAEQPDGSVILTPLEQYVEHSEWEPEVPGERPIVDISSIVSDIAALKATHYSRLVVLDPNAPSDISLQGYMLNTAIDAYPDGTTTVGDGAGQMPYNPGAAVSRAKTVTSEWQAFNVCTLDIGSRVEGTGPRSEMVITTNQLINNPPPSLSDEVVTPPAPGSNNLLAPGDFSIDTEGWVAGEGANVTVVNGKLQVARGGSLAGFAAKSVTLEVGAQYSFHWEGIQGTSEWVPHLHLGVPGTYNAYVGSATESPIVFTATHVTLEVLLASGAANVGEFQQYDNFSLVKTANASVANSSATNAPVLPNGFSASQVGPVTFTENFNTTTLAPDKWQGQQWYEQFDARDNYLIADGLLKIWNVQRNGEWDDGRTFNTDGGDDGNPSPKFAQKHGFFECRAKIPKGPSNWPAFWLYNHTPENQGLRRPEIDIMEIFGGDINYTHNAEYPYNYAGTVHDGVDQQTTNHGSRLLTAAGLGSFDLSAAFHTYGIKWDSSGVEFFFDGASIGKVTYDPDTAMYLIISMGTQSGRSYDGLAWPEPTSASSLDSSNALEVEYIRAWGLPDNSHVVSGSAPNPANSQS